MNPSILGQDAQACLNIMVNGEWRMANGENELAIAQRQRTRPDMPCMAEVRSLPSLCCIRLVVKLNGGNSPTSDISRSKLKQIQSNYNI